MPDPTSHHEHPPISDQPTVEQPAVRPEDDQPTVLMSAIDQPTAVFSVVDEPTVTMPAVGSGQPQPPSQRQPTRRGPGRAGRGRAGRVLGLPKLAFAAVAMVIGLAVVAGGLTVVDAKDAVPQRTRVLGVEIGGRSIKDAALALAAGLGDRTQLPVTVRIGDHTTSVDPQEIDLALDAEATAANAAEATPNPIKLITGREVAPVVTVNADKLASAVAGTVTKAGNTMTPPKITFSGVTPEATYPVAGQGLDSDGAAVAVTGGWLRQDEITLPLTDIAPKMSRAEVDRLLAEVAEPAVAAPVTVTTSHGTFRISRQAIAASLTLNADKTGKITPKVSASKLRSALADELAGVEIEPQDATVAFTDGTVKILASADGRLVDTDQLAKDLLDVLDKTSGRRVAATVKHVAAKTTKSELANLGIQTKVASFTTHFSGGEHRNGNIIQVAKKVDGAVVKPGETFSLNGYTGERSYAQGYVDAPVILDGKLVNAVGGGISQFTTTLFNAAYYAGLEDVFHKPHSYYISRYPSVIESTIYYPSLDLKFRNNTPYGVLIDTTTTNDSVTVTMWSTKVYDSVTTEWGPRRDVTKPKTVKAKGDECIPTTGGVGFAQDAWRVFHRDGKVVDREKFSWKYDAEPHVVCKK